MRLIDLATMLGLVCGAIATFHLGNQIKNKTIKLVGYIAICFFVALFLLFLVLLIRDFVRYGIDGMIPRDF